MTNNRSSFSVSARLALMQSVAVFVAGIVVSAIRPLINLLSGHGWNYHPLIAVKVCVSISVLSFILMFASSFSQMRQAAKVDAIGQAYPPSYSETSKGIRGFVAMEYYSLILNRSFIIFIVEEGLYGYKFSGPVDASDPNFFSGFAERIKDPGYLGSIQALRAMANEPGNFFIPSGDIDRVAGSYDKKWGMSRIHHAGRLFVYLKNGRKRDFILLGVADVNGIKETIVRRCLLQQRAASTAT